MWYQPNMRDETGEPGNPVIVDPVVKAEMRSGSPPTAPWMLSFRQVWSYMPALVTVALILFLRLVRLDQLQSEIYGDLTLIFEYLADIRAGKWPTYFSLSVGPLSHYAFMPVIALTGPTYLGLKLATVAMSLGALAATYALSRNLIDDYFALLATCIAGVSSWLLIFSRLGSTPIIVPLLTTPAIWLVVRAARGGRKVDFIACAVVSALGLYAFPQTFVLPAVSFLTLVCLRWAGIRIKWADLGLFILVTLACAVPFAWMVAHNPTGFLNGYIGGKLQGSADPIGTLLRQLCSWAAGAASPRR